jgi:predicted nucleic acid-binding protein
MTKLSSIDTNILLYAANEDCPEQAVCRALLENAVKDPEKWIIADQVYLELYRALRNPRILRKPRKAAEAVAHIRQLRDELGFLHCGYATECWPLLLDRLGVGDFPYQRTHDAVLSETLLRHGVQTFYTRNTKDFMDSGFSQVINPVDGR